MNEWPAKTACSKYIGDNMYSLFLNAFAPKHDVTEINPSLKELLRTGDDAINLRRLFELLEKERRRQLTRHELLTTASKHLMKRMPRELCEIVVDFLVEVCEECQSAYQGLLVVEHACRKTSQPCNVCAACLSLCEGCHRRSHSLENFAFSVECLGCAQCKNLPCLACTHSLGYKD